MESLALSYNHLPLHLRECFLYLGGFPEDYKFQVQQLILLWVAEGFIHEDGQRSKEDIAEGYLMDLIDRNLLIVAHRSNGNGAIKSCKVHDLVREVCLRKANEEGFIIKTETQTLSSHMSNVTTTSYRPVRVFKDKDPNIVHFSYPCAQNHWSILCFNDLRSLSDDFANCFRSFVLLKVLDLRKCKLNDFPKGMELLVHLRYLAIRISSDTFPSSVCNLWGLQTLIYISKGMNMVVLPSNISDMVNLRHLLSYYPSRDQFKRYFILPAIDKPMNLLTFSCVRLGVGVDFQTCFPCIKELRCMYTEKNDFKSFSYLEKLKLIGDVREHITLPVTLKTLALTWCGLPWSKMSIIQSLPNLHVLKLHKLSFVGKCWDTDEHEFPRLTFLRLSFLNIKLWKAYTTSFPSLKQLEIECCVYLEDIPIEIGEISTLELIKIRACRPSVGESVRRILEDQHDFGNYDLKIDVLNDFFPDS